MATINIRSGVREDIPIVRQLVVDLAVYEKEPDAVLATVDEYYTAFDSGKIQMLIAEVDGSVAGMMLYYDTFSTWNGLQIYLEDFYVKEAYRQSGVGQLLFDHFMLEVKQRGARLAKWQVLDWNTPAVKFYEKNNANIEKNWWNVKRSTEDL